MNKRNAVAAAVVIVALAAAGWWTLSDRSGPPGASGTGAAGRALASVKVPDTLSERARLGKVAFDGNCARCHGENAAGVNGSGPPLVHVYYKPSHHADEAFQRAVAYGVQAHHWNFGDMPPRTGLTRADVAMIVAYVRELQRANGIR